MFVVKLLETSHHKDPGVYSSPQSSKLMQAGGGNGRQSICLISDGNGQLSKLLARY